MNRPIPPLTRAWMRWHHNDMDARDWIDAALFLAMILGAPWLAGMLV